MQYANTNGIVFYLYVMIMILLFQIVENYKRTSDEGWALDGRKKDVKSCMWDHSRDWHGGVVGTNG